MPDCRPPGTPAPEGDHSTVHAYFFCGGEVPEAQPVAVPRQVPGTRSVLRAALTELMKGPDERERHAGYHSPFDNDSSLLVGVTMSDGRALVDFSRALVEGDRSGGSYYSAYFFGSLNPTVFQFPEVDQVTYRVEGDAKALCLEFQMVCEPLTRSEWEAWGRDA
jgi:spore germination protein GerM